MHVSHGHAGLHAGYWKLSDVCTALLIVSMKQRIRTVAGEEQRLRYKYSDLPGASRFWNVHALKSGIAFHKGRRVAVGDLPRNDALVHVVRCNPAIGRLNDPQTLDCR